MYIESTSLFCCLPVMSSWRSLSTRRLSLSRRSSRTATRASWPRATPHSRRSCMTLRWVELHLKRLHGDHFVCCIFCLKMLNCNKSVVKNYALIFVKQKLIFPKSVRRNNISFCPTKLYFFLCALTLDFMLRFLPKKPLVMAMKLEILRNKHVLHSYGT